MGSGSATITGAKLGVAPATNVDNSNTAVNGAAVFVDTGSVTFNSTSSLQYNAASNGGAVGVGSAEARLYFNNNVVINNNTMLVAGGDPVKSNVYLNFDTDAILNFQSLGGSADVGIYVSDDPVTVDGEDTTVLEQRGVPSTRFGVYVDNNVTSRLGKIHNDRTENLTVAADTTNKKVYWVRNFTVKVYYVASYNQGLPFGNKDYTNNFATSGGNFKKKIDNYNPPAHQMAASEIAADLRSKNNGMVSDSAVFGHAFVQKSALADMQYKDYITFAAWGTDYWQYTTSTGSTIDGQTGSGKETLIFIYTDPYYLSIENNAKVGNQDLTLVIRDLNVTVNSTEQSVIGNYGYVFAKNDEIQNELKPVTANDLVLKSGESIRILLPGGKNMAYSLTGQYYSTYDPDNVASNELYSGDVGYEQKETTSAGVPTIKGSGSVANSTSAPNTFTLSGNACMTPNTSGQTHELIFGGDRAVCRVVAAQEITGLQSDEYISSAPGEGATAGKFEYTFKSPKQAYQFIEAHKDDFTSDGKVTAKIEMLMDYMIPASDKVSMTTGGSNGPARDITFQTAVNGYFRYDSAHTTSGGPNDPTNPGTNPRATISRGAGNKLSFIEATAGTLKDGDYADKLTVNNLIFDGKSFGGKDIEHGTIDTNCWNVKIDRCDFNNCQAKYGGGIFIKSVTPKTGTPYGYLTVTRSNFNNCQSLENTDKYGGGGIWTSMKTLTVEDCTFTSCYCAQQGGALFHFVDTTKDTESYTTITDCIFEGCSAGQAAGSVESGAREVRITNTNFRNSTSSVKNGGALNIWSGNSDSTSGQPTTNCWVYLTGCTFENCYALNGTGSNGNGGAMRSTATYNTITDCSFINNIGNNGGAINIFNSKAVDTIISGCSFDGCSARGQGGAIWCRSKTLTIDSVDHNDGALPHTTNATSIRNCTAPNEGGGVYHDNNTTNSSLTVADTTIDTCYSNTKSGGGVYTKALSVSVTDSIVENCYTVAANQNGGGLCLSNSTTTTLSGTIIQGSDISSNIARGEGDQDGNGNDLHNSGGGIYTKAVTFKLKNSIVSDNQAYGNGGGICQNYNQTNGMMELDGATVTGNIAGHVDENNNGVGKGGGIFTLTNLTLRGFETVDTTGTVSVESETRITGNLLRTEEAEDAAGLYLRDDVKVHLRLSGEQYDSAVETDMSKRARITVTGNLTVDGKNSNLRLPDKTNDSEIVNDISVMVYCGVDGEVRVVNAKKKLTQFGYSQSADNKTLKSPAGFTDAYKVFWSEDGQLFGIVDRQDSYERKIIWGGDPICKITDANGRLLYLDEHQTRPAVFDRLDALTTGHSEDTSTTSAFSTLRSNTQLYYAEGVPYTGNVFQVKMLIEEYTAEYYMEITGGTDRQVTLTTAKASDSLYPYRGREGTRCTITRDKNMDGAHALVTAKTNLTLERIVLDGGSLKGVQPTGQTRVIRADCGKEAPISIALSRNATVQNAEVIAGTGSDGSDGNGGGVYLDNGAQLSIAGGTIRNCAAVNGGAVYIDGDKGTMTMTVGTITKCSASQNGGGVFFNKGTVNNQSDPTAGLIRISGGSITRCTAENGGGIYLNGGNSSNGLSRQLYMSGGSIASNHAAQKGGGIFVGDDKVRIYFSGAPYVYQNTSSAAAVPKIPQNGVDQGGWKDCIPPYANACNVQMDQGFHGHRVPRVDPRRVHRRIRTGGCWPV